MLNFDPYRWLDEYEQAKAQSVADVATVAGVRVENEISYSREQPATPATPATLPDGQSHLLYEWQSYLAGLNDCRAPEGFPLHRWQQVCIDSQWLADNFAHAASRDGWGAYDLFGVYPPSPGLGGLCDRLQGARNLKIEGQRAAWTHDGLKQWAGAGNSGDALPASGLTLIWELGA